MKGYLTTHVLDTARGCPARGVKIELFRINGDGGRNLLNTLITNDDGRTDAHILGADDFACGEYELVFHAGDYHRGGRERIGGSPAERQGASRNNDAFLRAANNKEHGGGGDTPPFLDTIPIRFGMAEEAHYHVPLLLSPYGYSTYRGS